VLPGSQTVLRALPAHRIGDSLGRFSDGLKKGAIETSQQVIIGRGTISADPLANCVLRSAPGLEKWPTVVVTSTAISSLIECRGERQVRTGHLDF